MTRADAAQRIAAAQCEVLVPCGIERTHRRCVHHLVTSICSRQDCNQVITGSEAQLDECVAWIRGLSCSMAARRLECPATPR